MAALIKEKYLDNAKGNLSIEEKSDLLYAVQLAYKSKLFTYGDICIFDAYLQGYELKEIAVQFNTYTNKVEQILRRLFIALEILTDYTDSAFVNKMRSLYSEKKINKLEQFLYTHGRAFE